MHATAAKKLACAKVYKREAGCHVLAWHTWPSFLRACGAILLGAMFSRFCCSSLHLSSSFTPNMACLPPVVCRRRFAKNCICATPLRPQPPRSAPAPRGLVSQQFTKLAETERASGQSQPLSAAKAQTLVPGLLKRTLSYAISRQTSVRFPMSNFICSAASEAGRPGDRCCLVLGHK